MERVGKIKEVKFVPRVGKVISLDLLSKRKKKRKEERHGGKDKAESEIS